MGVSVVGSGTARGEVERAGRRTQGAPERASIVKLRLLIDDELGPGRRERKVDLPRPDTACRYTPARGLRRQRTTTMNM